MTNPLALIPANVRAGIYIAYAVIVAALGAVLAGYAAIQSPAPLWVTATLAGTTFFGGAIGLVAASNVSIPAATESAVDGIPDEGDGL